jgi:hypothetical protein
MTSWNAAVLLYERNRLNIERYFADIGLPVTRFDAAALLYERNRRKIERNCAENGLPKSYTARMQNTLDLMTAITLLIDLKEEVPAAAPLLSRVICALYDVAVGAHPALFDLLEPQVILSLHLGEIHPRGKPTGFTRAAVAEGEAAVVAELLLSAMPKADAVRWLDKEIAACHLRDREGNPVEASRVMAWRKNFRSGRGAAFGRRYYAEGVADHRALIRAPKSDLKRSQVAETARALLKGLARSAPREMAVRQRRRTKTQRTTTIKKG